MEPESNPPEWQPPVAPGPPPDDYAPRPERVSQPAPVERPPYAGWWRRVGATLLDGLIIGVPMAVLALSVDPAFAYAVGIIEGLLYAPLLMRRKGNHNGQTLGKQATEIRVIRASGEQFDYGPAALREFVFKALLFNTLGGVLLALPTLLNYLWPLWDDENRALHDMLANTRVVRA